MIHAWCNPRGCLFIKPAAKASVSGEATSTHVTRPILFPYGKPWNSNFFFTQIADNFTTMLGFASSPKKYKTHTVLLDSPVMVDKKTMGKRHGLTPSIAATRHRPGRSRF